jgi:integrase
MGQDPQADKVEERRVATVKEIAELFLEHHVKAKRGERTWDHYDDILQRLVLPRLGSRKARDVARSDMTRLHLDWRHTKLQANRMLAVVGSMYAYAGRQGLVPEGFNPARGIEKYKEEARERYFSVAELERIGQALRRAETTGVDWAIDPAGKVKHVPKTGQKTKITPPAAAALRLLLFTGCRLREILHLTWDEVDFERGLLLLKKSKTGKKTVVLNAPALAVLSNIERVGKYVIAGNSAGLANEKPRSDLKRPWTLVCREAGLSGVRLHDLRHNFAAFGAGGGMGLPIIGKLLGHTQPVTTQRYAHLHADPLRVASNAIAAGIAAAMGEVPAGGKVVDIRSAARALTANPAGIEAVPSEAALAHRRVR